MDDTTVILTIVVEDVQRVAKDVLGRTLTRKEMELVKDNIDAHLDWYDAVARCINQEV